MGINAGKKTRIAENREFNLTENKQTNKSGCPDLIGSKKKEAAFK